jgi:hypothetical protein
MPDATAQGVTSAAMAPDPGVVIPRITLGEQGVLGLRVVNKQIIEEQVEAFRYPNFIRTVNAMRNNPTVGAAMNVYRMMMSRVEWDVEPPTDATPVELERAKIVRSMMDDMEHTWSNFIESVIPYLEYGFAVNEKVFRRRLYRNGSKFNDGLVGLRKLPTRSQDTITGWHYSQDGQDLLWIQQSVTQLQYGYLYVNKLDENGKLPLDRSKVLLFSASPTKGNPEGNSIYKNIYLAYKQLSMLQDQELVGIAKDVQGILKITAPARYFDPNASDSDKAVLTAFQTIIDNYNAGQQRGLLVPNVVDPESKQPLFTYDLMTDRGTPKFDIDGIIKRLQGDILSALSVDILKLGSEGTGSFSLAESKSSVLALAIDYRLKEIQEVLNSDLMRSIYELNGWETTNLPKFVYNDVEEISLEEFSKAVQRIFSVNGIEMDRPVMNRVRHAMKIPTLPEDAPVNKDELPANMAGMQSAAGAGMEVGTTGDGTSKSPHSGKDRSSSNADNAA